MSQRNAIGTSEEIGVPARRDLVKIVRGFRMRKLAGWRSRQAIAVLRVAWSKAVVLVKTETNLRWKRKSLFAPALPVEVPHLTALDSGDAAKPSIYISACMDAQSKGGWRYNGGIKEFNLLVKLLRKQGYEAFIVTYDGTYEPWLIDHQPVISLLEFETRRQTEGDRVRFVTSWATADAFLFRVENFYFWDMELHFTANDHFSTVAQFYRQRRIIATSGISRSVQAFHMANFDVPCTVVPNLIDLSIWTPDESKRVLHRIGYMDEGTHSSEFASHLSHHLSAAGIAHELLSISGDEPEILESMQSCDLYISMNIGKDILWGEGCPRTIIESMSAGCVNLSFDIIGNREIVMPGWNAVLIEDKTAESLATTVAALIVDRERG